MPPISSSSPLAIGLDGGATRIKWSARLPDGRFIDGEAPGANRQLARADYTAILFHAIDAALQAAEASLDQVASIGMGLAGVDRPQEIGPLREAIRSRLSAARRIWIGNDALPALRAGTGKLEGIILIAGTGSICVGIGSAGEQVRVGGWGSAIGDEGSGYWIGREALAAAVQMSDGRREKSGLLDRLLGHLHLEDASELIPWIYGKPESERKGAVAALAKPVLDDWCGDPAVAQIAARGAELLAAHVHAAGEKLPPSPLPAVVLAGSLMERCAGYRGAVGAGLHGRFSVQAAAGRASRGALALGEERGD